MKFALAFFLVLLIQIMAASFAMGAEKKAECKVDGKAFGIREIVGRGTNKELAFEDAAVKCYDILSNRQRIRKPGSMDEDTGLVLIDICANITCS